MLLITPPAAGTKASSGFTQHSSFPFFLRANENIVVWNKQLGVAVLSAFSLRWSGRSSSPQLFLPHSRGSMQQGVTQACPCCSETQWQLCAPLLSFLMWSATAKCPQPLQACSWALGCFLPPFAVPAARAQVCKLPTIPHAVIRQQWPFQAS